MVKIFSKIKHKNKNRKADSLRVCNSDVAEGIFVIGAVSELWNYGVAASISVDSGIGKGGNRKKHNLYSDSDYKRFDVLVGGGAGVKLMPGKLKGNGTKSLTGNSRSGSSR